MRHILDRPVWSALRTCHAALAQGGALARRYAPSLVPFAAAAYDSPESTRAFGELAATSDEALILLQADEIVLPERVVAETTASAVQLVADRAFELIADPRVEPLGQSDAADMLALVELTRPGPFTPRSMELGNFWGVKKDGRLVAMAGERLKQPGYTEVSGLCTHPELRRTGLGRLMSLFVCGQIFRRGDQPYIHAFSTNTGAIALYESIGFRLRSRMHVAMVRSAA